MIIAGYSCSQDLNPLLFHSSSRPVDLNLFGLLLPAGFARGCLTLMFFYYEVTGIPKSLQSMVLHIIEGSLWSQLMFYSHLLYFAVLL